MIEQWFKDPGRVGATVLLMTAVLAFVYEWVVTGRAYRRDLATAEARRMAEEKQAKEREDRILEERDEFKHMVLRTLAITERTIGVAEKKAKTE